uniref:condensation domain-containing protein n=1 Tax=Streptomyces sp. BK79 TaxID=3350097 RepID=UPI00376F5DF5
AVVAREDQPGHRRLVAYVIPHDDTRPDTGALRAHLADALPDYLVPSAFVTLTAFPLTSTGKIDRRALPAPGSDTTDTEHTAPRTPEQQAVCDVFAEVFGVERIGVDDDFFALGGHSLLAAQAAVRIEAATGVSVPLADLFRLRTPRSLAAVLRTTGDSAAAARHALVPAVRDTDPPLSFAQEGYLALARAHPDSHLWNVPFVMRARGPLDVDALSRAVSSLIGRHETLRTTISPDAAAPTQHVRPAQPVVLTAEPVPGATPAERESAARALVADEARRPFDLVNGPVVRVRLLRLDPHDHVIALTTHHMATDAWSQDVLWHEISSVYAADVTGGAEPRLPELPVQYADFAVWQRAWLTGDTLRDQWEYWTRRLAGCPTPLALPTDRPRTNVPDPEGGSVSLPLGPELVRAARERGAEADATLFMTLLAAFTVVLADETGRPDVAVGSPVAGRTRAELEHLVGGFANMLVLRTDVSGDPTFREALARTRETATGAFARQDMPFHLLAERFGDDPHGLVQVMFQLVNTPHGTPSLAGTRLESFDHGRVSVRMDLEVTLMEDGDDVTAHALFRRSLFDRSTIEGLLRRLVTALEALLAEPDQPVSAVLRESAGGTR